MKTHHYLLAAGAVALVAFLASRSRTSSSSALATAAARNAAISARFRQQLWSEVEPDFWA